MELENRKGAAAGTECRTCLGLHDAEIHDATLRVRGWLRSEIDRRTDVERLTFDVSPTEMAGSIRWSCY